MSKTDGPIDKEFVDLENPYIEPVVRPEVNENKFETSKTQAPQTGTNAQIKTRNKVEIAVPINGAAEELKTPKVNYGDRTPKVRLDTSSETIVQEANADKAAAEAE